MRFGVRLAVKGRLGAKGQGWDYTRNMALEAERIGFDSVWLPDHVINENGHGEANSHAGELDRVMSRARGL